MQLKIKATELSIWKIVTVKKKKKWGDFTLLFENLMEIGEGGMLKLEDWWVPIEVAAQESGGAVAGDLS